VDDTFKRLWQWGYNQRAGVGRPENSTYQAEFTNLQSALAFLKRCLTSLITDRIRADERRHLVPFPEDDPPTSSTVEEHLLGQEFWHIIEVVLTDERERRIIWLLYQQGLKPRQILERCPGEFENVQEIYRLTRNAIDRLKRHGAIIRYKIDREE
jgi:DNA-directed RNA polymerase specialized sigma24 family protein